MILRILNKDVPLRNILFVIGEGILIYASVILAAFLRFGNLPELLQMTLTMADTRGILGTSILGTHKVTFAPRRKTLTIRRIDE